MDSEPNSPSTQAGAAGRFILGDRPVTRLGYGAMQLAGPGVYGPPADPDKARAVLRAAVEAGITHIDTSDFYGPHVVNELIREALHPYPDDLVLVTKVGARRTPDKAWPPARSPQELRDAVHDNLRNLALDAMDVVNLRVGGTEGPVEESIEQEFSTLAELQQQGLIRHLGVSNVTTTQLAQAQSIAPVVCVQNYFNAVYRADEKMVDTCAEQGIAYVPFFPLGGFSPIQSEAIATQAERLGATTMQLALAWLLARSPTILVIPGTSSVEHLRENVAAGSLSLSADDYAELDRISNA